MFFEEQYLLNQKEMQKRCGRGSHVGGIDTLCDSGSVSVYLSRYALKRGFQYSLEVKGFTITRAEANHQVIGF